jgi:hypothetical protein
MKKEPYSSTKRDFLKKISKPKIYLNTVIIQRLPAMAMAIPFQMTNFCIIRKEIGEFTLTWPQNPTRGVPLLDPTSSTLQSEQKEATVGVLSKKRSIFTNEPKRGVPNEQRNFL